MSNSWYSQRIQVPHGERVASPTSLCKGLQAEHGDPRNTPSTSTSRIQFTSPSCYTTKGIRAAWTCFATSASLIISAGATTISVHTSAATSVHSSAYFCAAAAVFHIHVTGTISVQSSACFCTTTSSSRSTPSSATKVSAGEASEAAEATDDASTTDSEKEGLLERLYIHKRSQAVVWHVSSLKREPFCKNEHVNILIFERIYLL